MPATFAVAETNDRSASEIVDAFLLGAEASCRIGMALGRQHYEKGFHQTATAGAFGATVAAGRLLGLNRASMRQALSLVSTRASGLKSQFGTMGKPFNAGISASNGVEAAELARRGFVSADDGIGGVQGFIETHAGQPNGAEVWANPPPHHFVFEEIKYKLHACCHGTHAMIEALLADARMYPTAPDDVIEVTLTVNPRWLRVCDIKSPRTGLEVKFSYAFLAAMVFCGIDTSSDATYEDALCSDRRLIEFAKKVRITGDLSVGDMDTRGVISLASHHKRDIAHDLSRRLPASVIETGLRKKATALLGPHEADRLWSAISTLEKFSARGLAAFING
jgi:2-methylcitrate dehydratase PrpD